MAFKRVGCVASYCGPLCWNANPDKTWNPIQNTKWCSKKLYNKMRMLQHFFYPTGWSHGETSQNPTGESKVTTETSAIRLVYSWGNGGNGFIEIGGTVCLMTSDTHRWVEPFQWAPIILTLLQTNGFIEKELNDLLSPRCAKKLLNRNT